MTGSDPSGSSWKPLLDYVGLELVDKKAEAARLEYQHNLFRATFGGKRYFSPLTSPRRILDLGCGTGIWSMEISDYFSQAQVVGIDVNQIEPSESEPLNHHFLLADFEQPWPFEDLFDYIHGRMIIFSMRNHRRLIQQAFDHLTPGGWFESKDVELGPDGVVEDSPPSPAFRSQEGIMNWNTYMTEATRNLGVDLGATQRWPDWLEEAGFVNITHKIFKWPMGTWSEEYNLRTLGVSALENFLRVVPIFSRVPFSKGLGWSEDQIDAFIAKTKDEMLKTDRHYYIKIHVTYAQKPKKQ
jgi:trans-aconitate methyltransferase